jgi:hypothetical protein
VFFSRVSGFVIGSSWLRGFPIPTCKTHTWWRNMRGIG